MANQYHLISRKITFPSSTPGIQLSGTLTTPDERHPIAGILLLSGSGPQDRDESIAGQKPFRELAHTLSHQGFAVLRWDDRGVGESEGDYMAICANDLVQDVKQAANALAEAVHSDCIVLIGHSQGCMIAAKAARRWPDEFAAMLLLAGAGRQGREVLMDQHISICEAEGIDPKVTAASAEVKGLFFDVLIRAEQQIVGGEDEATVMARTRLALLQVMEANDGDDPHDEAELEAIVADLLEWEWRFLLANDPAEDLRKVRCPVLALTGEVDTQVSPRQDLAAIRQALVDGGNLAVTCRILPKLNHLFQQCDTGKLSQYESQGSPWANGTATMMIDWLKLTLKAN